MKLRRAKLGKINPSLFTLMENISVIRQLLGFECMLFL